jgi:hypothetical protein
MQLAQVPYVPSDIRFRAAVGSAFRRLGSIGPPHLAMQRDMNEHEEIAKASHVRFLFGLICEHCGAVGDHTTGPSGPR